jgi:hypothetical protein
MASSVASVTNQPVTLTATVTATSGTATPTGTVAFVDNQGTITGCGTAPLSSGSGTSATATCLTSYAASTSPQGLTAAYTPAGGSNFQPSATTSPVILSIGKDLTATALSTLSPNPGTGQSITYIVAVITGHTGPTAPSGTVAFLDGGTPIAGCTSQPVTGSGATCTTSYSAPGSHIVTTTYAGDGNFFGSISLPLTVTVSATPAANCGSAYNEGFNTGFNSGFNSGFASGFQSGFRRGFARGFNSGLAHASRLAAVASSPSARQAQAIPPECTQAYNQGFNTSFSPGFSRGFNPGYNPGFKAGFKSGLGAGRRARHHTHRTPA